MFFLLYTASVCNVKTKVNNLKSDIQIFWDHPTCRGWKHIVTYIITYCHDGGCVQYNFSNDTTSTRFASHNSTRHSFEIIAINTCWESTTIVEYNIEGKK